MEPEKMESVETKDTEKIQKPNIQHNHTGNHQPFLVVGLIVIIVLAIGAGATYVARGSVAQAIILEKYIKTAFAHKGTSVVVAGSTCPVQFGRRNRMGDPVELLHWLKDHGVPVAKAKTMSQEELTGKFITGELVHDSTKLEYTERYRQLVVRIQQKEKAK